MMAGLPYVEELAPETDPWHAARALADRPYLLFLDSAERHPVRGRFSYVAADPPSVLVEPADPFGAVGRALAEYPLETHPDLPPFQGGAAGLFGYGLQHVLERIPRTRFDEFAVPSLVVGIYDRLMAFDHERRKCWIVSTGYPERGESARRIRAEERARELRTLICRSESEIPARPGTTADRIPADRLAPQYPLPCRPGVTSNFSEEGYLAAVRRAIDYVHAGDCFQVNLSQRLLMPLPESESPMAVYEQLRRRNPAPFSAYFDLGSYVIASASPERFLRVTDGEVETRPIKGTRPRSADPSIDEAQRTELVQSAKDRAENVMIVDLLRNDIGRVCGYGTVRVPKVCEVESFRFVHHLVSEVRGQLGPGRTITDLLRCAFPGGSVTGAPKVRSMEIIAELEPTARGPYCGSIGFLGFDGSMDTNILIRTMTIGRGWMQFPVGGGITADSVPEQEYAETLHKAAGLLRAMEPAP